MRDDDEAGFRTTFSELKGELGRRTWQVLHFRKLTHSQKVRATQVCATSPITVSSVIICKRHLQGVGSAGNAAFITRPDPMYLWALRLLLERASWFVRDHGGGPGVVTFAHVRRFRVRKLHEYRRALELSPTSIHWPSFNGHEFRVADMKSIDLLQIADTTASAIFDAVEPDSYGNVEERYLRNLAPKLYRYPGSPVTSYGLKVFPTSQANAGGSLHRLLEI